MENLLLLYRQAATFWGPKEFSLLSTPVPIFLHLGKSFSAFLPFNKTSEGGLSSMVSQDTLVRFHSTFFLSAHFGGRKPGVSQMYFCYVTMIPAFRAWLLCTRESGQQGSLPATHPQLQPPTYSLHAPQRPIGNCWPVYVHLLLVRVLRTLVLEIGRAHV